MAEQTQKKPNILVIMSDDLGIADNTIVLFTSDNGAEVMSWPDGGNTPFKGEKGTTWEGGMRVPGIVRWPSTAALPNSAQGGQRRLAPVRTQLLLALPSGGAPAADD